MGHGIAQSLAAAGHLVLVYEPERARAAAGVERIGGNLQRSVDKGRITADDGPSSWHGSRSPTIWRLPPPRPTA